MLLSGGPSDGGSSVRFDLALAPARDGGGWQYATAVKKEEGEEEEEMG